MTRLSSWAIRLALVHLGVAFTAGAWLLAARGFPTLAPPSWLRPAHLELALLGWTLQLAMGVAYYILPRHATGAARGSVRIAVVAITLFNLGVLTVVAGAAADQSAALLAGRLAEAGGVALFASNAWPRIKAFGT